MANMMAAKKKVKTPKPNYTKDPSYVKEKHGDKYNKDYAGYIYDQKPDDAWNNYWKGFHIGTSGGDPTFGSTDYANWFNNDYKAQLNSDWVQDTARRGPNAKNTHLNQWMKFHADPAAMRSAWAAQSQLTRGLPGRTAARWMAV